MAANPHKRNRSSGPRCISEADARSVVQAQFPGTTIRAEWSAGHWTYFLGDTIVATATLSDRIAGYWRLDWKGSFPTSEHEPTFHAMEDAVRELDTAPISDATRATVNRMREEILRARKTPDETDAERLARLMREHSLYRTYLPLPGEAD